MPPPHATGAPAPLRPVRARCPRSADTRPVGASRERRSEEHTSELQSRLHLVCRLLLEKKKDMTAISIPTLELLRFLRSILVFPGRCVEWRCSLLLSGLDFHPPVSLRARQQVQKRTLE